MALRYPFQVAVLSCALLHAFAAPQQSRPLQSSYDADALATPGYWSQRVEASTFGPPRDMPPTPSMSTKKPMNPLGFLPSLDDAQKQFTGSVESLPYPNFNGFPLYPFTPYAQGLWWR